MAAQTRPLPSGGAQLRALAAQIRRQSNPAMIAQALEIIAGKMDVTDNRFRAMGDTTNRNTSPLYPQVDGSIVLPGTLRVDALIATVAWVTSAMIVSLSADKLTAGTIDAAIITVLNLVADNITSGTLNGSVVNVTNLNAANINSGFLSADRIAAGVLDITKLTLRQFISGVIFQNNTPPSPPNVSVTWDGIYAVYLEGTAYTITGGATTNKYIWFQPSVSTTAFQTGSSFTAGPGKFLVAINTAGVIEEAWRTIAAASITASMFSQGSVTGGASGAIATNTVTGGASGNLAINTITADNVVANTLSAKQMIIGNFENLAEDPGFEANSTASWIAIFAGNWAYSNDGQARNGAYALKKTNAVADDEAANVIFVPCAPGDTFYAEAWLKGTGNGVGSVRISFYATDKTTRTTFTSSTVAATSSYLFASVSATCPAGRVYARISVLGNSHTTGSWYADDVFFKRKTIASFIESVDADTITTGTLNAARIAAAAIDVTKLNIKDIIVVMTLTSNDPSAGRIKWASTTVYYQGVGYAITGSDTANKFVYWDATGSTFTAADSFTPQTGRFLIATNTGGTAGEAWNNLAVRNTVQESNIVDGLIRGIQPEIAHQRQNINTTTTYTLVNYSSGAGGLFSIGLVVVDSAANPPYTQMQVLLGIQIDGATEQLYAIYDGAYPYSGINSWDSRLVCIASDKKTPGYNVGDYITLTIGMGFSSSCVVKVYINTTGGSGTIRWDMTVLWGKKTA